MSLLLKATHATCTFEGRLGNNLFQVAALYWYARKHATTWSIPSKYEHTGIYNFGLPESNELEKSSVIRHDSFFDPIACDGLCNTVNLVGYFQSYLYAESYESDFRKILKLKLNPSSAISLHVRRGDFLTCKHNRVLAPSYYERTVDAFVRRGLTRFTVFSDDLDWCTSNLPACNRKAAFDFGSDTEDAYVALCRMASCAGHIVANSTFSWWGAWLNPDPDKTVLCPLWTEVYSDAMAPNYTKYLYPTAWQQVLST